MQTNTAFIELTNNQLLNPSMVHPMDDIANQARQGSVSAIIQVLNEKLAPSGVRTRAVFADGVLQLLCEAGSPELLDQSTVVDRIRQILESLAPRHIRRVHINSRLVREQQLLWLEEINRDPENQLLWSQLITLKKPNIFKQISQDFTRPKPRTDPAFPKSPYSRQVREERQFRRGILNGLGVSLFLVTLGLLIYNWPQIQAGLNSGQFSLTSGNSQESSSAESDRDAFAEAVRLAEQASADGKVAQTSSEWLVIAAKWEQASVLMDSVPEDHPRYKIAQNRTELYRSYSEDAQTQGDRLRQEKL